MIFTQRGIFSQGLGSDVFYVGKMQQHEAPVYRYDLDAPEEWGMIKVSFPTPGFINTVWRWAGRLCRNIRQ